MAGVPPRSRPLPATPRIPGWWPYAALGALLTALVCILAGIALWQERSRYRERALIAAENVAQLLEVHVADVLAKADVALQAVALEYDEHRAERGIAAAELRHMLPRAKILVREVSTLWLSDSRGNLIAGSEPVGGPPISIADRDYFLRLRDTPDAGLAVSGPLVGRVSGNWNLALARRLNNQDGSFAGLVVAVIGISNFEPVFSRVSLGEHGAATIRNTDLALIYRQSAVPTPSSAIGSREVSSALKDAVRAHPNAGRFVATTTLDGIERANAYRRIPGLPFYVIVGLATDDYLGGWRSSTVLVAILTAMVVAITALSLTMIYRAARRHEVDAITLHRLSASLQTVREEERAALARNIHDDIGQSLTALKLQLAAQHRPLPGAPSAAAPSLETVNAQLDALVDRVRHIAYALRPPALDELGLCTAIAALARNFSHPGTLDIDCHLDPEADQLAPPAAIALYRVVQECLTNIARHASASRAHISLQRVQDHLVLQVDDNGIGVAPEIPIDSSLGLVGMRERAHMLGGSVSILPRPEGGTRVRVDIPVDGTALADDPH